MEEEMIDDRVIGLAKEIKGTGAFIRGNVDGF
jgi:hypothetical protein